MSLVGVLGRPFVDLSAYVDTSRFDELHEEICYSLARVKVGYTGGSHKWMGIVPPSLEQEPYIDYGHVIDEMTREEFVQFVELSDTPFVFNPDLRRAYTFGEERDHPLSFRQMLFLKYRFGVYFPWKVFYELIAATYWDEKSTGAGKDFLPEAKVLFPKTLSFVKSLPFRERGRCLIMGVEGNDHGTVHRDGVPEEKAFVDHFITICPHGDKRLFLWDEEARTKTFVDARAYWFNDSDYHGVEVDPFFRYSVRVDGVFEPAFIERLERDSGVRFPKEDPHRAA